MTCPTLKLKKNEDRRVLAGHLWIFSNEVDTKSTPLSGFQPGETVTVTSASGKPLANAYLNPHSLICARIFSHHTRQALDSALFAARINQARNLRQQCFHQPFYRLIYSEGDLLPGLVVDRFDNILVMQISTLGMDIRQNDIAQTLDDLLQPATIILNNSTRARELEGLETFTKVIKGEAPDRLRVMENDVPFHAPAMGGQKTGWFYDHRMNRFALRKWIKDKTVLDVFSYAGGWGIQAAVAGARAVHCIETSETACELLRSNAQLNNVADRMHITTADAFDAMTNLKHANEKFDVIVLDPPAFIKRKKDVEQGAIAYQRTNKLAMQLLNENGILVSASCSFHLPREQHLKILRTCARETGHQIQVVEEGGLGPDHPVHPAIAETAYLSCFTVRMLRE
ncbi:MAG: class I SAM-dependent rRNA methyltransferase [Gammaproteobacteria bacterium]|nr:class I SAM-dependent rRNA methyltransferase [Gammaproteobacteria bacterium]